MRIQLENLRPRTNPSSVLIREELRGVSYGGGHVPEQLITFNQML